ncbi:formylglycine-generating enzyme family protein [Crocosphaera sp.]|uniref:formylglycine-generating enzyme family protein n=1 Tax=Crocosphaera sp. TaxID=2729996 RepID=UPI00260E9312|nr:formylglycine-generating enzyme family protein [Crocosphaera sp.]MDJ0580560.1 formylglycine-generating enzyme family protein [Crocosphaera sp.]
MATKLVIKKEQRQARYYTEDLGDGITLDMMEIPGDEFMMGTDDAEIARLCKEYEVNYFQWESPQHKVTVPRFFMGKYPITQAQWKAIASRTDLKVNIDLKEDPSHFKDPYQQDQETIERWLRPVEQVSWYEAVEFCERLSKLTKRDYRLPSEAQWEYACRAGTTTAFHFGETITTDLANYRGTDFEYEKKIYPGNYGKGPKGIYREQTTPVGHFKVANAFGLYDMHGNVWEWCQDDWHGDYKDAPTDGSAWLDPQNSNLDNQSNLDESNDNEATKLIRGGSWYDLPDDCRCANRYINLARDYYDDVGFRVVSGPPRT